MNLIANTFTYWVKTTTLIGLLLLCANCQNIDYPKKPKNLIPEDKMVEVLIDVHLFNAAKTINRLPLEQTGMSPHEMIYKKHDIDSAQFAISNAYYGAHIDTYERIHQQMKTVLEAKKTVLDTLVKIEKRQQDSIQKVKDSLRLLKNKINSDSVTPKLIKNTTL